MLKLACLALLALAAQLQGSNAFYTDDADSSNLRMIGGETVNDATTYSYQVAIRATETLNGDVVAACSGVLIQGQSVGTDGTLVDPTYYILTSAVCAMSGQYYNVWVGTNEVKLLSTPTATITRSSATTIIHPEFVSSGMTASDLAILVAPAEVTALFTSPTATARPSVTLLPSIDTATKSYLASSVNMAGWGSPNELFDMASPRLRQLNSRVVPNFYCKAINFGKPITNRHICTGGLINKGPCTGDSGAPLIIEDKSGSRVIGLATLVPANGCSKGKPGVFTRLGSYQSWIVRNTRYNAEA